MLLACGAALALLPSAARACRVYGCDAAHSFALRATLPGGGGARAAHTAPAAVAVAWELRGLATPQCVGGLSLGVDAVVCTDGSGPTGASGRLRVLNASGNITYTSSAVHAPDRHAFPAIPPDFYGFYASDGPSRFCGTLFFQIECAALHSYGPDPHSC